MHSKPPLWMGASPVQIPDRPAIETSPSTPELAQHLLYLRLAHWTPSLRGHFFRHARQPCGPLSGLVVLLNMHPKKTHYVPPVYSSGHPALAGAVCMHTPFGGRPVSRTVLGATSPPRGSALSSALGAMLLRMSRSSAAHGFHCLRRLCCLVLPPFAQGAMVAVELRETVWGVRILGPAGWHPGGKRGQVSGRPTFQRWAPSSRGLPRENSSNGALQRIMSTTS